MQAQKQVKLEQMVSQWVQEEPEGEVIAGPSGESVESLSSGNTPLFLFEIKLSHFFKTIQLHYCRSPPFFQRIDPSDQYICYQTFYPDSSCSSGIVSLTGEPSEDDELKVTTQEQQEIDWVHTWMEAGGASLSRRWGTGAAESGIPCCFVLFSLL